MGTLGFLVLSGPGFAQAAEPTVVSTTATLSILAGTVKRVPAGSIRAQAAKNGMNLRIGDRVLSGAKALVTFLDGSTLTVQPDSDVEVKRADVTEVCSTQVMAGPLRRNFWTNCFMSPQGSPAQGHQKCVGM